MLKIKETEAAKRDLDEQSIKTTSKVLCKILKPGCKVLEKFSSKFYSFELHNLVL